MTITLIPQDDFTEIIQLIAVARLRAVQAVNTVLIDLYWQVGQTISRKIAAAEWGDGWWRNWRNIWRAHSRGCAVLPSATCFGCGSFMKLIKEMKLSHHW